MLLKNSIAFHSHLAKVANSSSRMSISINIIREQRLRDLVESTGYEIKQLNGQRRYGPPPNWSGAPPPKGCEVFVGKLPRDLYEDELVPLFQSVGTLYELRLMMDFSNSNRGFAFVTYTNLKDADAAISNLDNFEIRVGRKIGVCKSVDNCRLFIGGIPRDRTREEIFEKFASFTDGLLDVILYNNVLDKTKNRGFAFLEYESHRAAAMARRKLIPARIPLWGQELAVDWAEPEPQVKEEVMSRVTVLFARNLTLNTTEDQLREIFSFSGALRVDKVKKLRDYAFIHYFTREEAEFALVRLNGIVIDSCVVEVTWSKPPECSLKHHSQLSVDGYRSYPRHFLATRTTHSLSRLLRPSLSESRLSSCNSLGLNLLQLTNSRQSVGIIGDPPSRSFSSLSSNSNLAENLGNRNKLTYSEMLTIICLERSYGEPVFDVMNITADSMVQAPLYTCKVIIPNLPLGVKKFISAKFAQTPEEAKEQVSQFVMDKLGWSEESIDLQVRNGRRLSPLYVSGNDYGQGDGIGRSLTKQTTGNRRPTDFAFADHGDTPFSNLIAGLNAIQQGISSSLSLDSPNNQRPTLRSIFDDQEDLSFPPVSTSGNVYQKNGSTFVWDPLTDDSVLKPVTKQSNGMNFSTVVVQKDNDVESHNIHPEPFTWSNNGGEDTDEYGSYPQH